MKFLVLVLACLLACVNLVSSDTPADCRYSDAMGTWKVSIYNYTTDRTISGEPRCTYHFTFDYPNLVSNHLGHLGTWTMIYNQGFEVKIDNRKFLFMFWYSGMDSKTAKFSCQKTMVDWTHDKMARQWYNFQAEKISTSKMELQQRPLKEAASEDESRLFQRNDNFIRKINAHQSSWTAAHYPEYEKMTLAELKRRAGRPIPMKRIPKPAPVTHDLKEMVKSLPSEFDWRRPADGGPSFVTPVRNQLSCGSCYAFASAAALEARIQVFTNRTLRPILSTQDIVDCSLYSQGCEGGFAYLIAGKYGEDFGFVEESCNAYKGSETGSCKTKKDCMRFYATDYHYLGGYYGACNEALMMLELVHRGPFPVGIMVYDDFMNYKSGVYQHTKLTDSLNNKKFDPLEVTNHAVLLVGYGFDNDLQLPYWTIKNSWSERWGEEGYVRILRGSDEISVESLSVSLTPML